MKRILLLFIALAAVWGAAAKIRLPEIIGNDMVLQQNAEVRLWGWAEPYAAVKVETSWGAGAAVKSDAEGRWVVSVRTPAGSYEPQRITFASGDRVTFDRVLIGEVWFAGGQSNMEMPLGGFWQCPVTDANEIIARQKRKTPLCEDSACRSLYAAGPDGRKLDALHDRYCGEIHRCGLLLRRNAQ